MSQRVGGTAFGVYDFFAYVAPGVLLLAPLLFFVPLRTFPSPLGGDVTIALVVVLLAYVVGLAIHALGRLLERGFLEKQYPSETVFTKLKPIVAERLRDMLRQHFALADTADDSTLWQLAYRHLSNEGLLQRVQPFLLLHVVSRGTLIVLLGYGLATLYGTAVLDPRLLAFLAPIAVAFVLFNHIRQRFNGLMAEEVCLSYYATRRSELDRRQG